MPRLVWCAPNVPGVRDGGRSIRLAVLAKAHSPHEVRRGRVAAMLQPSPMVLVFRWGSVRCPTQLTLCGSFVGVVQGCHWNAAGFVAFPKFVITPTKLQQNSHMPPTTVLKWNYVSSDCSNKAETGRASQSEIHYPRIKPCMGPETSTQVQCLWPSARLRVSCPYLLEHAGVQGYP